MTTDTTTDAQVDETDAQEPTTTDVPGATPDDGDAGKARREAADLRRRLKQAETMLAKHEEAGKTELERAAGRAEAAESEASALRDTVRELSLAGMIRGEAQDLGVVSPEAAARLMDRDTLEWGDNHQPTRDSVLKALRAVVKEFPFLTAAGDIDHRTQGTTANANSTADRINHLIRGR